MYFFKEMGYNNIVRLIYETKKQQYQLKNKYWLKVVFFKSPFKKYDNNKITWLMDIVVGKTKRQINDHFNSTRKSPKCLLNKSTNNKGGIESLLIALTCLKEFENTLPKGNIIRIEGCDEQRIKVYSRLLKYGFVQATWYEPKKSWHGKTYYLKEI